MTRRGKKKGKKHWIAAAVGKPGALHKEMGIPTGEKIPAGKLAAAADSGNSLLAKRARLAQTLEGFHHQKAGSPT